MKYLLTVILSIGLLFSVCHAQQKLELKDQKDKESYSLGYQFGQSLKSQGVDINLDIFTSGTRDAFGGKEPQMSQEDIRAAITGLQQRLQAARQKELKEMAAKNLEESKKFLTENQKKEDDKGFAERVTVQSPHGRFRQNAEGRGYGHG